MTVAGANAWYGSSGLATGITFPLSGMQAGDQLVTTTMHTSTTVTANPTPGTWTKRVDVPVGTRGLVVCTKAWEGESSVSVPLSVGASHTTALLVVRGAQAHTAWVYGAVGKRAASSATTTVPGVSVPVPGSLVLTLAGEATTATEATGPTVTAGTSAQWMYAPQSAQIETVWVGTETPSGGSTSDVTLAYVNASANGIGIQIAALAPAAAVGGRPKVWTGSAYAPKPGKWWNGTAWVEKPWKRWNGSSWTPV